MGKNQSKLTASPRTLRAVSELNSILKNSKDDSSAPQVALFVGAGVDISLNSHRPNWEELIAKLGESSKVDAAEDIAALKKIANKWPLEAAEALRTLVGTESYWRAIQRFVGEPENRQDSEIRGGLKNLVQAGLKLIVTFNYTSDLLKAIREANNEKKIRAINASNLAGWNYRELLSPPVNQVHVVFLHGRVDTLGSKGPPPLLDRKSYDKALFGSAYYDEFLNRVFQDFTVVTIGSSLTDVPVRSAAAEVKYRFPISSRTHYAIYPHHSNASEDMWFDRGLVNSYSIQPLFYSVKGDDHSEAGNLLAAIASAQASMISPTIDEASAWTTDSFSKIADYLDYHGDYASGLQTDWLSNNWKKLKKEILSVPDDQTLDFSDWHAFVRIERHFRHFIWFFESEASREASRKSIWLKVARLSGQYLSTQKNWLLTLSALAEKEVSSNTSPIERGLFEFALGAFEIPGRSNSPKEFAKWIQALKEAIGRDKSLNQCRRMEIAKSIWTKEPSHGADYEDLKRQAGLSQWEAIQAKIMLDQVESHFPKQREAILSPRERGDSERELIRTLYLDAASAARLAGNLRREIGSIVTGSFIEPLIDAETNLIAIYRKFSNQIWQSEDISTHWWIYIGLLSIFSEIYGLKDDPNYGKEAAAWLEERCGEIKIPNAEGIEALRENQFIWWGRFHSGAVTTAKEVLKHKCQ